jgi:hypothetical protein
LKRGNLLSNQPAKSSRKVTSQHKIFACSKLAIKNVFPQVGRLCSQNLGDFCLLNLDCFFFFFEGLKIMMGKGPKVPAGQSASLIDSSPEESDLEDSDYAPSNAATDAGSTSEEFSSGISVILAKGRPLFLQHVK